MAQRYTVGNIVASGKSPWRKAGENQSARVNSQKAVCAGLTRRREDVLVCLWRREVLQHLLGFVDEPFPCLHPGCRANLGEWIDIVTELSRRVGRLGLSTCRGRGYGSDLLQGQAQELPQEDRLSLQLGQAVRWLILRECHLVCPMEDTIMVVRWQALVNNGDSYL